MGPARAAPGGGAAGSASPSGGGAKQRSGGALAPAAVGPGGGEAARCEHQRGQAALVRVQAGREVVQRRLAAHGGDGAVRPAAAWSRTSVETSRTRRNVESMSTSGSPRVDLSYGAKITAVGGGSSTAEWISASLMAGGRKNFNSRRRGCPGWDWRTCRVS